MDRNCFGTVAEREKEVFKKIREELVKLGSNNHWKTAHHLRISSILNETEMYLFPFRWNECFGYHLYRWTLWLPLRSMFWEVFPPTQPPLSEETVKTIIDLLLPFQGFLPHTSIYNFKELPLSGAKFFFRNRIPYNLSFLVNGEELRLDREPYFLTPEIETKSLLLLMDIFDAIYWHHDPDLRYYTERFDYLDFYKKYIIESTRLLHHEGAISSDIAYHRVLRIIAL